MQNGCMISVLRLTNAVYYQHNSICLKYSNYPERQTLSDVKRQCLFGFRVLVRAKLKI